MRTLKHTLSVIAIPATLMVPSAIADSDNGTLKASDPKWDRPSTNVILDAGPCDLITNDSANDQVPHDVYYIRALNFTTLLDITVTSLEPNPIDLDPMIAVYCGPYDINNPLTNLEEIDDDSAGYPNPHILATNLMDPNTIYTVIVSSYSNYAPSLNGDYIIELGPNIIFTSACLPDFSGDGVLDFFDISAFLTLFNMQDPSTDLNFDGNYDFFDISAFLNAFGQGCP